MNTKLIARLAASTLLLSCEIHHAAQGFEIPAGNKATINRWELSYEKRSFVGLDHSHTESPEDLIYTTSSISASGIQMFEVYAIHSEGPPWGAIVSAKTLPQEPFCTSEREANKRADQLQDSETRDNIRYSVRPVG